MNATSSDAQKQKRALPRQWGCLRLLLLPLIIASACYGGMWLFARYGGEWAISDQIPLPPGSERVNISLPNKLYREDVFTYSIYLYPGTPEDVRAWYEKEWILFLPDCDDVTDSMSSTNCYDPGPLYYGWSKHSLTTSKVTLYTMSIVYTVPAFSSIENWQPIPFTYMALSIYADQDNFDKTYPFDIRGVTVPDIKIPDDKTIFSIKAISPQRIGWWFSRPL
jgi:hypothetical protein